MQLAPLNSAISFLGYNINNEMSTKKELDFTDVRQLCASIAAEEEILVVVLKARKYSIINLPPQRKKSSSAAGSTELQNVKTLEYILLNELNIKGRDKLMDRMSDLMRSLKTTDLPTARSFLKLERYGEIRKNIILQLNEYVAKDLKMTIASRKVESKIANGITE